MRHEILDSDERNVRYRLTNKRLSKRANRERFPLASFSGDVTQSRMRSGITLELMRSSSLLTAWRYLFCMGVKLGFSRLEKKHVGV
jgi:hypothetical protein